MSCEWVDLQLLKKGRCEDKKSLWVSVLYPSCMYQAAEHGAFIRFSSASNLHFWVFTFIITCFLSFFVSLSVSVIFLLSFSFSFSFSHSVSQIVVWTPQVKDTDRKRVREKDSRRKSGVQCARGVKADKLVFFWYSRGVRETKQDAKMGRKKIQITRIMDERNRQVSSCYAHHSSFNAHSRHVCLETYWDASSTAVLDIICLKWAMHDILATNQLLIGITDF